ncbi:MAG: Wzt carbohydrate-binding domain-containing protein, partial [Planctomycetota bacterium]|nr:Wzt carbohydrate-binding domain-containing protein [Planctomycetota bacterium]
GADDAARGIAGLATGPALATVEILEVEVLGPAGRPQLEFRTGEQITFRLRFGCEGTLDRPVIGFGIYREDGLYLTQVTTEASGHHTGVCSGESEAVFQWECPFTMGGYRVSASIADSTGRAVLAQAHSVAGFEIAARPGFDGGVIRLDGQWSVGTAQTKSTGSH